MSDTPKSPSKEIPENCGVPIKDTPTPDNDLKVVCDRCHKVTNHCVCGFPHSSVVEKTPDSERTVGKLVQVDDNGELAVRDVTAKEFYKDPEPLYTIKQVVQMLMEHEKFEGIIMYKNKDKAEEIFSPEGVIAILQGKKV